MILLKRAVFKSNLTLTRYLSKMRLYWIPPLRCELRMWKPLRYHSLTHFHQQPRRKRKESTWNLLSTWSTQRPRQIQICHDKEVSTEAHSSSTIPLNKLHEPQALVFQCLKEPSYAKTVKDPCTQVHKSRNHHPKKIFGSKQVGYLRWRHIILEGYQILKKKGWKGLVGHPNDRGRHRKLSFSFHFPHI
jgi:hypothetical protein